MINKLVSTAVLAAAVAGFALPAAAQAQHYDRYGYSESRYDDDDDDRYERRDYQQERRGYGYSTGYQPRYNQSQRHYDPRYNQSQRHYDPRYEQRRRYAQQYQSNGYYGERNYGNDYYGQQSRRCSKGSTGTILGAIAGGLIGNGVAGRGDRTLGAVLGGGAGALAGRAIDRNGNRC
jgi:Ni/Co efflux regulator RcnB